MPPTDVDFLHPSQKQEEAQSLASAEPPHIPTPKPRRRRYKRKIFFISAILAISVGSFFVANVVLPSVRLSASLGSGNFFKQITHLTFSGDRVVQGEDEDRINVLLLGIGGQGHDGPLLADTIILASLEPSTGRMALVSFPRDLYVPFPDGTWRKLNEAYAAGVTSDKNGGAYAAKTLSTVLGTPIPYHVLVDFSDFETIIDAVNGINVNVERTFSDPLYPSTKVVVVENEAGELVEIPQYDPITFASGWQHMNGITALKFARSRHGNNGEGSDFARAKRQQKILLSLKDRVLDTGILLNPVTVNRLTGEIADSMETNIEPWEALRLYQFAKDLNSEHVIRITLNDSPGGLLKPGTNIHGQYILQPRHGNFQELQRLAQQIFDNGELVQEPPRIEVLNGTTISGLATRTANELANLGYQIVHIGNAENQNINRTTLFDFTHGSRQTSLATLRIQTNAEIIPQVPEWLLPSATSFDPNTTNYLSPKPQSDADFVLVLGRDRVAGASDDYVEGGL